MTSVFFWGGGGRRGNYNMIVLRSCFLLPNGNPIINNVICIKLCLETNC